MTMHNEVTHTLNNLIETSHDGEYGFRELAEHAKSPALKQDFVARADAIRASASELQRVVVEHGGKPDDGGTASGALHRGWVAVRSKLTTFTDLALLEEAERGEDKALAAFRKATKEELPAPVRMLVERQLEGVQRNHDQIKQMRDQHKQMS